MNKKKIVSLCLIVCLLATAVVGGTLAYFTDTDAAKNVMTTGNVSIVQNERERSADGKLVAFTQNKPLYPVTGDADANGYIDQNTDEMLNAEYTTDAKDKDGNAITAKLHTPTGDTLKFFSLSNNAVDKVVTVTNDGNSDAYIRTLMAFEVPKVPADFTGPTLNGTHVDVVNVLPYLSVVVDEKDWESPMNGEKYVIITVDGVDYLVVEYYYNDKTDDGKDGENNKESALDVGETSHASLCQIYLSSKATNEDAALVVGADGEYNILVLSQAAQTAGFTSAKDALNTAFGDPAANAQKWFDEAFASAPTA